MEVKKQSVVWLIVSQVIGVLAIFPWLLYIGGASLAAALGTSDRALLANIFYLIVSYPLVLLVCIVATWVLFWQKKQNVANIVTSIPMIYVVPGVILLAVYALS
jgi:uncharacterized iron-regulated membrane protein